MADMDRYNNKKILVNSHLDTMYNLQKMRNDNSSGIKQLLDTMKESLISLHSLGVDTTSWDCIIIYLMVKRLTTETHQLWEESQHGAQDLPTMDQFKEFLESRYRTLEVINSDRKFSTKESNASSSRVNKKQSFHAATSAQSSNLYTCVLCKAKHSIRECEQFKTNSAI